MLRKTLFIFIIILLLALSLISSLDFMVPQALFVLIAICFLILKIKKTNLEELVTFFLIPYLNLWIFSIIVDLSQLFEQTDTIYFFESIIIIPISNWIYLFIKIRKMHYSYKKLNHLVTTIQSILFFSTIFGYLIGNPLLFDGFLTKYQFEFLGNDKTTLSSLLQSEIQILVIPFLISSTFLKAFLEYRNFKIE